MSTNCGRRRSFRGERGQTILVAVLAMTVLLGFTALAIDVGMLFEDRRHFQNSADAMALAGVAELPANPSAADTKAREWATNNGVDPSEIKTIEVRSTGVPNDTLYVELEGDFGWIFGRALGQISSKVGAQAAARIGSLSGGFGAMPWALLEGDSSCLDASGNAIFNSDCAVKVGAGSSSITGWYGALDYDGNGGGSAEYESNIIDNETVNSYCVVTEPSAECDAYAVDALTGNKVGGTDQGIDARLAAEPTSGCSTDGDDTDDFDEVFVPNPGGTPTYLVVCPGTPRLVLIPIVSIDAVPVQTVTVQGWTLAYLKDYACVDGPNCQGGKGHWEVNITIVDAVYSQTAGFLTAFDPTDGIAVRRLIE